MFKTNSIASFRVSLLIFISLFLFSVLVPLTVMAQVTIEINDTSDATDAKADDNACDIDGNESNGKQCSLKAAIRHIYTEIHTYSSTEDYVIQMPGGTYCIPDRINISLPNYITNKITIKGNTDGGELTILDGGNDGDSACNGSPNNRQLFYVQKYDLTFRDLMIRNAKKTTAPVTGGAIEIRDANVTLLNVTMKNNRAVQAASSASYGGAVYLRGTDSSHRASLNILNSSLYDNQARSSSRSSFGGAVYGEGYADVRIVNSILANNLAFNTAAQDVHGGGVCLQSNAIGYVSNSTIVLNQAVSTSTGTASGGGLFGTFEIKSSLVAFNDVSSSSPDEEAADCSGTIISHEFNAFIYATDDDCDPTSSSDDLELVSDMPADSYIAEALDSNGGFAKTLAILENSPLIGSGNCISIEGEEVKRDGRGADRVNCTTGAFEYGATEALSCDDNLDNDGDGLVDMDDPDCPEATGDDDEGGKETECFDMVDNDGDGVADCDDKDCIDAGLCAVPLSVDSNPSQSDADADADGGDERVEDGECSLNIGAVIPSFASYWLMLLGLLPMVVLRRRK